MDGRLNGDDRRSMRMDRGSQESTIRSLCIPRILAAIQAAGFVGIQTQACGLGSAVLAFQATLTINPITLYQTHPCTENSSAFSSPPPVTRLTR